MAFSLVLNEVALIYVAIAVVNDSVTVEMSVLESSFVGFILESVSAFSIFFIILELAIVDCSTCFNQNTPARFLSHNELASIFSVLTKIPQFSLAVEFIVGKLSLIFDLSFKFIDSTAVFLAIAELPCVGSTISFF